MIKAGEALVFDYDGVIADTEPLHWRSWSAVLSRYGIELRWDEYCAIGQGVGDAQIFELFSKRMRVADAHDLSLRNDERKRMVRDWSLRECPIPQDTVALFKTLGAYKIGLVTSSEEPEVAPVLRASQIYDSFGAMVFGGEPAEPKPSPAPYLLIAEKLRVKKGIAFEDSEPGLESARAAGFKAVKVARPCDLAEIVARSLSDRVEATGDEQGD